MNEKRNMASDKSAAKESRAVDLDAESRVAVSGEVVLICGSREGVDEMAAARFVETLKPGTRVITGGARGVDAQAHKAAVWRGLPTTVIEADWERYGRRAGYIRNCEMLDHLPDRVVAFWDGKSRGTQHTITEARRRRIPVEVIAPATREQDAEANTTGTPRAGEATPNNQKDLRIPEQGEG